MRKALLLTMIAIAGCGGSTEVPPEYPPNPDLADSPSEEQPLLAAIADTPENREALAAAMAPIQVVAGTNTAIEGATPTLRVTSPRNGARIARGPVNVRVALSNWSLAPDPGNHVHVIVDNEPYIAVRDVSHEFDLAALVHDNLGHDLAPGTHVVRIFPSRPTHESVKTDGAFAMFTFVYGAPTQGFSFDATAPLLTFSRPKGCNVTGNRVLLDFYLTNVPALSADGLRVHYTIDEISGDITSWVPHFIENLLPGQHTIRLQLMRNGEPVAGPFNDTSRTITVDTTCPNPHAAAAPAAAEHAGH